jgi:hydroxymethylglutaryl-CoA synthase
MLSKIGQPAHEYYQNVGAMFFHRPYHQMPVQALSCLYARGLVCSERHQEELRSMCAEAGVRYDDLLREMISKPDLYSAVLQGNHSRDPYAATSAVAGMLRKHIAFKQLLLRAMSLGTETMKELGNLYTAALPAWIAAGLEEAALKELPLASVPMVAVGYGSGDAAEAVPISPVEGWQEHARHIQFARALEGAIDLDHDQYETLHDRRQLPGYKYVPRSEFAITRIGTSYDAGFQDLGVEYYDYAV